MRVRVVDPANIDAAIISEAAGIIRGGGLVVFPTETVYGVGADGTNADAVTKIFRAKGRPTYNPLILHVQDAKAATRYVAAWPSTAAALATEFWPGPLTLVLHKQTIIPDVVTAGLTTVGIRVPSHPVALALIRAADRPVAAPSANQSMQVSPTEARHVISSLGAEADFLLDAGPATVGIESTVIDLTSSVPTILRPGMISRAQLSAVIGEVRVAGTGTPSDTARPSPGMLDRHYSPRARLVMAPDPSARSIDETAVRESRGGKRVVVVARSDYQSRSCAVRQMPTAPTDYARALYAMLHQLDAERFDVIVIEPVPTDDPWDGVRDRLTRAATS